MNSSVFHQHNASTQPQDLRVVEPNRPDVSKPSDNQPQHAITMAGRGPPRAKSIRFNLTRVTRASDQLSLVVKCEIFTPSHTFEVASFCLTITLCLGGGT